MKKHLCISLIILVLLTMYSLTSGQNVVPVLNGDSTYGFSIANMYMKVDPNYGARVTSMKLNDQEIMYVNQSYGDYWGGTLWISPQSEFWPPSQALDVGPYSGGIVQNSLSLLSKLDQQHDPPLTYRKTFTANLSDTSFNVTYAIINKGTVSHKYSGWELTRVPTGGMAFFPAGTGDPTGGLAGYIQVMNNIVWYKYNSSDAPGNKYFCDGSGGWDAWVSNSGALYVRKFQDVASDKQAPGEAEIELWLNGPTSYIELEIQSEYTNIDPGDSLVWNVKWLLRQLPAGISTDVGSNSLISYVQSLVKRTGTGINSTHDAGAPSFTVYPNPCANLLSVYAPSVNDQMFKISIYSLQGLLVYERVIYPGNNQINTSTLPAGFYIYKIADRNGICKNGKILIARP